MPDDKPWLKWIPGVLSKQQVLELEEVGRMTFAPGADVDKQIDHSSVDLTISEIGYEMLKGAIKPLNGRYSAILADVTYARKLAIEGDHFTLEKRKTYVFKIQETIDLPKDTMIYGQATAKSSIGRVDVLARLIVNGMNVYESFDPEGLRAGKEMFLEITPLTFDVKVKPGIALTQLRLFYCDPRHSEVNVSEIGHTILKGREDSSKGFSLSLSLDPAGITSSLNASAFGAIESHENEAVPLWDVHPKPCPTTYWEPLDAGHLPTSDHSLDVETNRFYILRSKETLVLPKGIAAYCRGIDETIGEMRIHYAGFVHPFFGKDRPDGVDGTPLIFEVRGHDVKVTLRHGEIMANLIFYRMSEDCIGKGDSDYNDQKLKLSKFFAVWPDTD